MSNIHITVNDIDLNQVLEEMRVMSAAFDNLKAAVENENTVLDSVVTLLTNLATELASAKDDPAAIQALADEVNAKAQTMADAVAANTPAEPPTP